LFRINPQLNRCDEKRQTRLPAFRAVAISNPALLAGSDNSTGIFVRRAVDPSIAIGCRLPVSATTRLF
jgi:hypothetical protein